MHQRFWKSDIGISVHIEQLRSKCAENTQVLLTVMLVRLIITALDYNYFTFQCNSPAIIGFYGAFFVENRISICTEFMDGKFTLYLTHNTFVCNTMYMYATNESRFI